MSRNSRILTALCRSGRSLTSSQPRRAVPSIVPSRSSSSAAPSRAKRRRRRSATLMLRVPSSRVAVEVAELALFPNLDRPAVPARPADADAFGIKAAMAEGRGAAGADPFVAALVAPLLLGEPVLQRLHDLVPRAEAVDRLHLLGREIGLGDHAQPFLGNLGADLLAGRDQPLEHLGEHPVEPVELALVMNEGRAGEIIELLGLGGDDLGIERFKEQQMLLQRGWNAAAAQRFDEADEHVFPYAVRPERSRGGTWLTRR